MDRVVGVDRELHEFKELKEKHEAKAQRCGGEWHRVRPGRGRDQIGKRPMIRKSKGTSWLPWGSRKA